MSTALQESLQRFSALLEYPSRQVSEVVSDANALLDHLPQAGTSINAARAFVSGIRDCSKEALEELYTATFDLNPSTHLYAGFALFGENYKRGALLVELKKRLEVMGINVGTEVPDFLPLLLRLLAKLSANGNSLAVEARELQKYCLYPALQKITDAVKNSENPYSSLLVALREFLAPEESQA